MQNVSNDFENAIRSVGREFKAKINFPDLELDDENIVGFEIDSKLTFDEDFEVGTAPMDKVKVELAGDMGEFGRNLILNSGEVVDLTDEEVIETTVEYYDEFERVGYPWGRNLVIKTGSLEGYYVDAVWFSTPNARTPKEFIKVVPGGMYTMSVPASEFVDNVVRMSMWDENKDFVVRVNYSGGSQSQPIRIHTIIIPDNVHYITPGYGRDIDIKIEKGPVATPWTPAPEDFNNLKGKQYNLSTTLKKDQWYTLSVEGDFQDDDFIGVWLGSDKFIGFLQDNELTLKSNIDMDDDYIIVKSLSEEGIINWVKLEKGNTSTDWTPAPEDILEYNYKGESFSIKVGTVLPNESIEYVNMGIYTVEKVTKQDNVITLEAVDNMYKAEKEFENDLMFPTTVLEVLKSACEQSGLELITSNFANSDYVIPNEPVFEGLT